MDEREAHEREILAGFLEGTPAEGDDGQVDRLFDLDLACISKPCCDVSLAAMNKELVSDELWRIVEPLLPTDRGKPGSKRRVTKSVGVRGFTAPLHQPPLWC